MLRIPPPRVAGPLVPVVVRDWTGTCAAEGNPVNPDHGILVAVILPVPIAPRLEPVPTTRLCPVLVPEVTLAQAVGAWPVTWNEMLLPDGVTVMVLSPTALRLPVRPLRLCTPAPPPPPPPNATQKPLAQM